MLLRSKSGKRIFIALLLVGALLGGGLGVGFSYFYDFPELDYLENYRPNTITRIYSHDKQVLAELYQERRIPRSLSEIPPILRQALLSIEDSRFYEHPGVSYPDIFRAFVSNLRAGRRVQGGSTITQQLAKVLFLTPERTYNRKIREALLALEIERRFTKDEILEFYLNQIYLGSGAYGVEAAAKIYFDKNVGQLTLAEAATIAGLPKAPFRFNPQINRENALKRRKLVLQRMRALGFISKDQEKSAIKEPLRLAPRLIRSIAPDVAYFVENIRRQLDRQYGPVIYRSGLQVNTTLDLNLQRIAYKSLRRGVEKANSLRGFFPSGKKLRRLPRLGDGFQFRIAEVKDQTIRGIIEGYESEMDLPDNIDTNLLQDGDIVIGRVIKVDHRRKLLALEWQESIQGAVIALEPRTGVVRAMVGGTNFRRFQFNRAVQSRRQPGSAFKPVIMAAALSMGYTPNHILMDSPFVRRMPGTPKDWKPRNYTGRFYGPVTIRRALQSSLNLATIKLLDQITPIRAIDYARRLGIGSDLKPYLSLALGSFEVSLIEFTAAFIPFATGGVYSRPYQIIKVTDGNNRILEENVPQTHKVLSSETAYQINLMLRGVVTDGTGLSAKDIKAYVAGKTGTTNQYRDAWFIGYSNDLVVGVWLGRDDNKDMGFRASGAVTALPVWKEIMKKWLGSRDNIIAPPDPPPGIRMIKIDAESGLLPSRWCKGKYIMEAFVHGTEPTEVCPPKSKLPGFFNGS